MDLYGYIYITTNLVNNKKYIGKHKACQYDPNYIGSGILLSRAVEKYGLNNFTNQILDPVEDVPTICYSRQELNESEKFYTQYYDCVESEEYYNLKEGGEGGFDYIHAHDLHKHTGLTPFKGHHHTDLSKQAISEANKKILAGVCKSDEHKRNISKALQEKGCGKGCNNSNYGKVAYFKDDQEVHIYPDLIEYYVSLGYQKGRPKSVNKKAGINKGRIWIYNPVDKKRKRVIPEDLGLYLSDGWVQKIPDYT